MSAPAKFVDGRSPVKHDVLVSVDGKDLRITGDGVDVSWPLKKIAADDAPGQGEYFISVRGDYDARLTIKDIPADMMAALEKSAPQAFHKGAIWRKRAALVVILAGSAAAMLIFAFVGVPMLANPLAQMLPPSIEARMGPGVMSQVKQTLGEAVKDDDAQDELKLVVKRIAQAARAPFALRPQLIDSEVPNAFALPGGQIVVTCALVTDLQNPAELQAVLAHEISHVTQRHVMAGIIRGVGAQVSLAVLTGGSGGGALAVKMANQAAQMSYSRSDEAEADRVGISYLEKAQLDASGLSSFFDRMAAKEKAKHQDGGSFISSHPPSKARADAARRKPLGPEGQSLTPDQWAHLKQVCVPAPVAPKT